MEMADAIVINKADGDNRQQSEKAKAEYQAALHLFPMAESGWEPRVLTCSALKEEGLDTIWQLLEEYQQHARQIGWFKKQRQEQDLNWMHTAIEYLLRQQFYSNEQVQQHIQELEEQVGKGETAALSAARKLFEVYRK